MKLAVIPARGGSKRIPRKNIKPFCGKPMIAWSIEAAKESGCFDRIIVSTDDDEISEVAKSYGVEAPFMRPKELSDDFTPTVPVINHAINWQIENGATPEAVCCIYATAPFIRANDLVKGLSLLSGPEDVFSFPITSYPFAIQRAVKLSSKGRLKMFHSEHAFTRSQDLEEAYHDAGQFYWGRTNGWLSEQLIFGPNTVPIIVPRSRVQDIDTPEDWDRAEFLFKALCQNVELVVE